MWNRTRRSNFDRLLKWASELQKNHCLLIRDRDGLNYKPLVPLRYGLGYNDLAPYLSRLLDDDSREARLSGSDHGRKPREQLFFF
jgi:hypothetical protein